MLQFPRHPAGGAVPASLYTSLKLADPANVGVNFPHQNLDRARFYGQHQYRAGITSSGPTFHPSDLSDHAGGPWVIPNPPAGRLGPG